MAFQILSSSKRILTPPQLAPQYIKEKIICIRGHRERLFYVASEHYHDKLLFHNYGQGGAGWTYLFGCVQESISQFEYQLSQNPHLKDKPICVIGAGCYGLLTAIILSRKGHTVHIIAKDIRDASSYKAAGIFFPRPRKSSTPEERAIFYDRGITSYTLYQQIAKGDHPFIHKGAYLIPAYYGLDVDPGFGPYIEQNIMQAPAQITIDFGNGKLYQVNEYSTIFMNSFELMQELHQSIQKLGISIEQKEIESFDEVSEQILFNCAGLGAKKLVDDKRIVPVQGHLITLQQQPIAELNYIINTKVIQQDPLGRPRDELIYFAPKESGILGITFIRGQDSLTANQHEFDRLIERCHNYFGT